MHFEELPAEDRAVGGGGDAGSAVVGEGDLRLDALRWGDGRRVQFLTPGGSACSKLLTRPQNASRS